MPKITDKKTGKVRRFRYTKGGHDEYKRALRERIASIAPVVGAVGAQRAIFKRQGDTKDAAATATRGGASTLTRTTGLQTNRHLPLSKDSKICKEEDTQALIQQPDESERQRA